MKPENGAQRDLEADEATNNDYDWKQNPISDAQQSINMRSRFTETAKSDVLGPANINSMSQSQEAGKSADG